LIANGLASGAEWEVINQTTNAVLASGNANASGIVPGEPDMNLPCNVSTAAPVEMGKRSTCPHPQRLLHGAVLRW